jgi:hypothetical protein
VAGRERHHARRVEQDDVARAGQPLAGQPLAGPHTPGVVDEAEKPEQHHRHRFGEVQSGRHGAQDVVGVAGIRVDVLGDALGRTRQQRRGWAGTIGSLSG